MSAATCKSRSDRTQHLDLDEINVAASTQLVTLGVRLWGDVFNRGRIPVLEALIFAGGIAQRAVNPLVDSAVLALTVCTAAVQNQVRRKTMLGVGDFCFHVS